MAEKPRVKAPKQRKTPDPDRSGRNRRVVLGAAALGLVAVGVVAVVALAGFGGSKDASAALASAGCTLESFPGVSRAHTRNPTARPQAWTSFPPTSGPHYVTPAVYGFYDEPVELARILHGLEHGGVYMLYGSKVPADTPERLREIYDRDPRGFVVAPLPELGKTIALGAWTSENSGSDDVGTGHLAKCTQVDKKAFEAFVDEFRGRGPEGASLDQLLPGST